MSCELVRFCTLSLAEQASWVQAIGSIVAIAVAVWVPFRVDQKNRAAQLLEKRTRAKAIAVSLLPYLYRLRDKSREFVTENTDRLSVLREERELEEFDSDYLSIIPDIANILKISPELGVAQDKVTELAFHLFKAEEMIESMGQLQREGYHTAWINNLEFIVDDARQVIRITDEIIAIIEADYVS